MILKRILSLFIFSILLFGSCKQNIKEQNTATSDMGMGLGLAVTHAKSFSIQHQQGYTVLTVNRPWPGATKPLRYLVVPKQKLGSIAILPTSFDAVVTTPVQKLIATSTTHIPALQSLNGLDKLVGFPDTKYISSMAARERIAQGKIKELGSNENLNTELVLALKPDLIIGFGIDKENNAYHHFKKANIPLVFNGDWTEETPLGKAEWIKFFGVLLAKEKQADSLFNEIKQAYNTTKTLAKQAKNSPSVLSGALYKDVWYLPAGQSWASQFLKDANANYLFADTQGTGSLSLGLEGVIATASQAEFWVSPGQFTAYTAMLADNQHYQQFKAFKDKKVFSVAATKGPTGGLLYYELAGQRPDWVLKDLVHILHPELLPAHTPYFFTPLQ